MECLVVVVVDVAAFLAVQSHPRDQSGAGQEQPVGLAEEGVVVVPSLPAIVGDGGGIRIEAAIETTGQILVGVVRADEVIEVVVSVGRYPKLLAECLHVKSPALQQAAVLLGRRGRWNGAGRCTRVRGQVLQRVDVSCVVVRVVPQLVLIDGADGQKGGTAEVVSDMRGEADVAGVGQGDLIDTNVSIVRARNDAGRRDRLGEGGYTEQMRARVQSNERYGTAMRMIDRVMSRESDIQAIFRLPKDLAPDGIRGKIL